MITAQLLVVFCTAFVIILARLVYDSIQKALNLTRRLDG